jgi:SAM-dependent methyltransferase
MSDPLIGKVMARIFCKTERIVNRMLYLKYGFDRWHIGNGSQSRGYKKIIATKINLLHPETVIEIGCGLGDILRHAHAPVRVGCDIDERVISAARVRSVLLGIDFRVGDSCVISENDIDVLIMVNWIHNLSPEELAEIIGNFITRTRYFIFDSIDPNAPKNYKYGHDFGYLSTRARLVDTFRVDGEPRTFLIWESLCFQHAI